MAIPYLRTLSRLSEAAHQPEGNRLQNTSYCRCARGVPFCGPELRVEQPAIGLYGETWVSCFETVSDKVRRSKWSARGWTYQEGLFARRRLYFTEEQVYFECNSICCQEMVAYNFHNLYDGSMNPRGLFTGGFSNRYNAGLDHHIQALTTKDLTFGKRAINAVRGIFRAFATMPSPIRHVWGIPVDRYAMKSWANSCWLLSRLAPEKHREAPFAGYYDSMFSRGLCWYLDQPSTAPRGISILVLGWLDWSAAWRISVGLPLRTWRLRGQDLAAEGRRGLPKTG